MFCFKRARNFIRWARFAFLIAACGLVFGCARREPPADITIINGAEPESLDPALLTGQPEMRIAIGLFEGLTRLDPKTARPIPGLAESWEISPDGTTYTFHLRTNLVWSTGGPITRRRRGLFLDSHAGSGDGFRLCRAALLCEKCRGISTPDKIKDPALVGVHAPDPFTVRVELNHPTPFFLDICAMPLAYVVPRQTIEKYGDRWLMARPLPVQRAV